MSSQNLIQGDRYTWAAVVLSFVVFAEILVLVLAPSSDLGRIILTSLITPSLLVVAVMSEHAVPAFSWPVILNTVVWYVFLGLVFFSGFRFWYHLGKMVKRNR